MILDEFLARPGQTLAGFGAQVGVSHVTVIRWRDHVQRVPAERCADIERVTGGMVTKHDLRPDIFGPAPAAEDAA